MSPSSDLDPQVNRPAPKWKILDQLAFHKALGFVILTRVSIGEYVLFLKLYDPILLSCFKAAEYIIMGNIKVFRQFLREQPMQQLYVLRFDGILFFRNVLTPPLLPNF